MPCSVHVQDIALEAKGAEECLISLLDRLQRAAEAEAAEAAQHALASGVAALEDGELDTRMAIGAEEGECWAWLLETAVEAARDAAAETAGRCRLEAEEQEEVFQEEAAWRRGDCEQEAQEWMELTSRCERDGAALLQWLTVTRCYPLRTESGRHSLWKTGFVQQSHPPRAPVHCLLH